MPRTLGPGAPKHFPGDAASLDRRGFLTRLGLFAGAAALAPLTQLRRSAPHSLHRIEAGRPALGTWMRVVVRHPDEQVARAAIEDAFAAVRRVDAQMSIHREDSDLARVNAAAGRSSARVHDAVLDVVTMACDASMRSGGIFDPTVLPLMHLYGFYGPERTSAPSAREVDAALGVMGVGGVKLDRAAGTLALDREGAGLDLGSIGKGWAVDRAVDALRARGVRSGLVDIGGKMYGLGSPDDDAPGWTAGLFHPVTNQLEHVFVLRDAAVGTSGNSERFRVLGGTRVGHLFDARRGVPSAGHLSASVVSPTCLEADLLCTVAFLVGPDRFRGWPGVRETRFIG